MARISAEVEYSGRFFTYDPVATFKGNLRLLMEVAAREGEEVVRSQVQAGEGSRAELSFGGRVSEHIVGRVSSLSGNRWKVNAIISPSRAGLSATQAIALYAAASEIQQTTRAFHVTRISAPEAMDLVAGL